jgi:hypothetical protein
LIRELLANENLPLSSVMALRTEGFDVLSISDEGVLQVLNPTPMLTLMENSGGMMPLRRV